MKRVHESVDYVTHRDPKQAYNNLVEEMGNVGLNQRNLGEQEVMVQNVHSIKITGYKITKEGGSKYACYVIRAYSDELVWEVIRRYSDFRRLHDDLSSNGLQPPPLPPKRMFGSLSKDFLERRRTDLEHYLRTVIGNKSVLCSQPMMGFLWESSSILIDHKGKSDSMHSGSSHSTGFTSMMPPPNPPPPSQQQQGLSDLNLDHHEVNDIIDMDADDDDDDDDDEEHLLHNGEGGNSGFYSPVSSDDEDDDDEQEEEEEESHSSSDNSLRENHGDSQNNEMVMSPKRNIPNSNNHKGTSGGPGLPPIHPKTMKQSSRGTSSSSAAAQQAAAQPSHDDSSVKKPSLDDFEMVRVLGKGSFGKVVLCRKRDTGKLYAMKVLKKKHVVKRKQVAHTKTERSVLGQVDHPFIVRLHYAFQTGSKLHFVLDYCSGGELFFHLGRAGRFGESLGGFYAAEIALALGHLHSIGVVYRDLKPENILLDAEGHIKLADFGLSKEGIISGIKGTHSFCGTPEYLAPEILNRTGHGTSVDWWSLGALLYEMLTGLPPWYSQDRQKMFAGIRNSELRFPDYISPLARGILQAFLNRDVTKRLGSTNDVEEVKAHPFFQNMDWEKLFRKEIQAPFVPRLASKTDTANFDSQFTRMPIYSVDQSNFSMSPSGRGPIGPLSSSVMSDGNMFDGFTFVEQSNLIEHMKGLSTNDNNNPHFRHHDDHQKKGAFDHLDLNPSAGFRPPNNVPHSPTPHTVMFE